jgi:hypothetical protein
MSTTQMQAFEFQAEDEP